MSIKFVWYIGRIFLIIIQTSLSLTDKYKREGVLKTFTTATSVKYFFSEVRLEEL
jgi:hypothetical protein